MIRSILVLKPQLQCNNAEVTSHCSTPVSSVYCYVLVMILTVTSYTAFTYLLKLYGAAYISGHVCAYCTNKGSEFAMLLYYSPVVYYIMNTHICQPKLSCAPMQSQYQTNIFQTHFPAAKSPKKYMRKFFYIQNTKTLVYMHQG